MFTSLCSSLFRFARSPLYRQPTKIPESVLKKRKATNEIKAKADARLKAKKSGKNAARREIFKRAGTYRFSYRFARSCVSRPVPFFAFPLKSSNGDDSNIQTQQNVRQDLLKKS
jgi:hypothetical protein